MTATGLPEGWSLPRLDQIARVTSGKRLPKGQSVTALATPHPYIRVTDMRMGKVDLSNIHYVPEDVAPTISRYTVDAGDLYISCAGTLGIVGLVPEVLDGANLTENANRVSGVQINPHFLLHVLMSEMIQGHIQNIQTVGAQPKLALGRIRSFEIPCPDDPKEQEAIAEALSDADALIEGLERLIAKKRLIKQGAMQDLLTAKRRLPGFSGEWVATTFGQCFQFLRTGSASRSKLGTNLGVGYIHYGDIHGMTSSVLDLSRTRLPEIAPEQVATLSRVQDGDLVIADASEDVTDVGKSVEVRGAGGADIVAGLHTFLLRGNSEIVADGFKAYIQFLRDVRAGIESIATGSSVYGISKKNLAALKFRVPPVDEQAAIGRLFADMDAEIQALETRLEKARQVKEGMMQNLLTGRIRLV